LGFWLSLFFIAANLISLNTAESQIVRSIEIKWPMNFYGRQPSDSTCWAACDAMLLKSQKIAVSAKDIVIKQFDVFDPNSNQEAGADLDMPAKQITNNWTNKTGQIVKIDATVSYGVNGFMSPACLFGYTRWWSTSFYGHQNGHQTS
jgi:hypothetical protein